MNQLSPSKKFEDLLDIYGSVMCTDLSSQSHLHFLLTVDMWLDANSRTPADSGEVIWPSGEEDNVIIAYIRLFGMHWHSPTLWVKSVQMHYDKRWGHLKRSLCFRDSITDKLS